MQSGNRSCIRMQRRFTRAFPDQTNQHVLQPENRLISFQKETGRFFLFRAGVSVKLLTVFSILNHFLGTAADTGHTVGTFISPMGFAVYKHFCKKITDFSSGSFAILRAVYSLFPVPVKYRIIVFSLPFIEIHSTIIQKSKDDNSIKNMYDRSCLSRR